VPGTRCSPRTPGAPNFIRVAALYQERVIAAAVLSDSPSNVAEVGLRDHRSAIEGMAAIVGLPVTEIIAAGWPEERAERLAKLDPDTLRQSLDGSGDQGSHADPQLAAMRCPTLVLHRERAQYTSRRAYATGSG